MWTWISTAGRVRSIEEKVKALEGRLEDLKRLPSLLEAEWQDHLDRMNKVMGRLNARDKVTSATRIEEPEPDNSQVSPQTGIHAKMQAMRNRRHGLLPG